MRVLTTVSSQVSDTVLYNIQTANTFNDFFRSQLGDHVSDSHHGDHACAYETLINASNRQVSIFAEAGKRGKVAKDWYAARAIT